MQHKFKSFQLDPRSESIASSEPAIWIVGATGSGKTAQLLQQAQKWAVQSDAVLIFAASAESQKILTERLVVLPDCNFPGSDHIVTPTRFFQREVNQFWSLLQQQLGLKPQLPFRLHPEAEQDLAARLWQPQLESGALRQPGVSSMTTVERMLNLLRLAAAGGTPHEQIALILEQGWNDPEDAPLWQTMNAAIQKWWRWCLDHGFLTYSILTELYWRYLLPQPAYHQQLRQRYRAILADDVDEYPAVMRGLFEFFLNHQIGFAASFNPNGGARLGLGADPNYLSGLASRCQVIQLKPEPESNLGTAWGQVAIDCIRNPLLLPQLPDSIRLIQTVSKAQLLRQTAEAIVAAVQSGAVQPQDVAIVSPGLDAITRYTLQEILQRIGISLTCLNLQQPVIRSPLVRALLTLLTLIYPNLGRLAERESIAEMLVILSQAQPETASVVIPFDAEPSFVISSDKSNHRAALLAQPLPFRPRIDPVRAGLLADHCFVPDPVTPQLLPAAQFTRWDRLGYQATQAYSEILQWISQQSVQPSLPEVLERAIQRFVGELTYDQHCVLQEFREAVQHYWEVETRLSNRRVDASTIAGRLVKLLRAGTITANPTEVDAAPAVSAVTLSTIYQYRNARCRHRWQFWLDAGSSFWLSGSEILFNAPLFLQRPNRVWTAADALAADQDYLEREIQDLMGRATERIYLCYCELAINGQEQTGPLMPLINGAIPVTAEPAAT